MYKIEVQSFYIVVYIRNISYLSISFSLVLLFCIISMSLLSNISSQYKSLITSLYLSVEKNLFCKNSINFFHNFLKYSNISSSLETLSSNLSIVSFAKSNLYSNSSILLSRFLILCCKFLTSFE